MCSHIYAADKKSDNLPSEEQLQPQSQPLFLRKRPLKDDDSSNDDAMDMAENDLPSSETQRTISEDVDTGDFEAADFFPDFFP